MQYFYCEICGLNLSHADANAHRDKCCAEETGVMRRPLSNIGRAAYMQRLGAEESAFARRHVNSHDETTRLDVLDAQDAAAHYYAEARAELGVS